MADLYIPIILGTAREGRRSESPARYVLEQVQQYKSIDTKLFDVRESGLTATIPPWADNPKTQPWQDEAKRADGFIIVAPEYNHGYPGELKMFMDQALKEYVHKPLAICGVASGGFGGVRMVEVLRIASIEWGMVPIFTAVYFSKVQELFDESGAITDSSFEERVKDMLDELLWMGQALKKARLAYSTVES